MAGQHIENLFRRFKGEVVDVKTVSGGIYAGRVVEVTNDYVCLKQVGRSVSKGTANLKPILWCYAKSKFGFTSPRFNAEY